MPGRNERSMNPRPGGRHNRRTGPWMRMRERQSCNEGDWGEYRWHGHQLKPIQQSGPLFPQPHSWSGPWRHLNREGCHGVGAVVAWRAMLLSVRWLLPELRRCHKCKRLDYLPRQPLPQQSAPPPGAHSEGGIGQTHWHRMVPCWPSPHGSFLQCQHCQNLYEVSQTREQLSFPLLPLYYGSPHSWNPRVSHPPPYRIEVRSWEWLEALEDCDSDL